MPDLTSLYADRASLGVADGAVPASPLRLGALAAAAGGAARLALDTAGNVTAGVLTPADIPAGYTRRDVAEVIIEPWTWNVPAIGAPAATSRSLGTRLVMFPVAASTEYAIGIEAGALWRSVPTGSSHKFYQGATERLRLDTDGTLRVLNGSGHIDLGAAGTGDGRVVSAGSLYLGCAAGTLTLGSGAGSILPLEKYRENLGAINRKYLSLHCAELWAETLVAAQTLATIGGRILVGPTTTLTRDCLTTDTTIYVKHNLFRLHTAGDEFGSKVLFESGGKMEVMAIDSQTAPIATAQGDYGYAVIRGWDGGGNDPWFAGDAAFDTGKGFTPPYGAFIDLYSVRGVNAGSTAGPTIVGNYRKAQNAFDWREHWAIGNLKGLYGIGVDRFGAAFGDRNAAHLMIDATDGITFRGASGAGIQGAILGQWDMNGVITLGLTIGATIKINAADGTLRMAYNGVDKVLISSDGNAYLHTGLVCGLNAGTVPSVRSINATAYNVGRGFFFSHVTAEGTSRALIGNSAGRRLQWDGASLMVITDGLTLDENGITVLQGNSTALQPGRLIRFGTTGMYFWDTTAGIGDGFWVRQTGNLSMSAVNGTSTIGGAVVASNQSTYFAVSGTAATLGGQLTTGRPPLLPANDGAHNMGGPGNRWLFGYFYGVGIGGGTFNFGSYVLHLTLDAAAKPISTTWKVPTALSVAKDVTPVDPEAALALVRRVPLSRFRYNGADGTPAGADVIGAIAEHIEPIMPASVGRQAGGGLDWNAHELFVLNVAAVQALAARLDRIEGRT